MANKIIVPERRIEVVGNNGYSRRDFLGLAGRLGAGILAASVGFGALDGLVGNEENAVYAQGKNGKKKNLKWKDYSRNPEKATITYDSGTDRTLSKEFIEWDMKGFWYPKKCPILEEEPDLPQKILEVEGVDPVIVFSNLRWSAGYGKDPICSIIKSPWKRNVRNDTPENRRYRCPEGEFIVYSTWEEGIKDSWGALKVSQDGLLSTIYGGSTKKVCILITQMQLLDEMLDKKTKPGKEYDVRLWKTAWDAVKKKVK